MLSNRSLFDYQTQRNNPRRVAAWQLGNESAPPAVDDALCRVRAVAMTREEIFHPPMSGFTLVLAAAAAACLTLF